MRHGDYFLVASWLCENFSSHLDDGFDDACFWPSETFEIIRDRIKTCAVSDPWCGIDRAVFDQPDDQTEVFGEGITTGFEGDFWFMEDRMFKGNRFGRDADIDQGSGVCHILKGV